MASFISWFVRRLPSSVPRPWAEGFASRGFMCFLDFAAVETPSPEAVPDDLVASPLG